MSISSSLYTAAGALNAYGNSIAVVGHNIANTNTAGFKASRTEFADLLPTHEGEVESGSGVRLAAVSHPFRQGAVEATGNTTDLAIEGSGFFVVKDADGNSFFTRAGEFRIDKDSKLANPAGLAVQGSSGDIVLSNGITLAAQHTTTLAMAINLDPSSTTPASVFPAGDASSSAWFSASNFSTVASIFDSRGELHDLIFLFRKSAANTWDYRVVANRKELDGAVPNSSELRQVGSGTLSFTAEGSLDTGVTTINAIGPLDWVNGSGSQTLAAADLKFTDSTQFAQPSALFSLQQDGSSIGALTGITIDGQGNIMGHFSNGATQTLNRIALANFPSIDGLEATGDALFVTTRGSGNALIGVPGEGGLGTILSGGLGMSTVDLAQEFVTLITSQRAFQVSSRVITVADEMYTEAANLKR